MERVPLTMTDHESYRRTSDPSRLVSLLAAIGERWEQLKHRYGYVGGLLALANAREDVPRLLAAVEAVLALHAPVGEMGVDALWCGECATTERPELWPCSTYRVISRALLGEEGSGHG